MCSDQVCLRCVEVRVVARAAVEHINPVATLEQIVALVTTEVICTTATANGVVTQSAVNVVDVIGCDDGIVSGTTIDLELVRTTDEVIAKNNAGQIHGGP